MNKLQRHLRNLILSSALLSGALAAGCSASKDPILGGGVAALAPVVTAEAPGSGTTGVSITAPVISVTFSEPVAPISGGASFTVTCLAPCVNPTGSVALNSTSRTATFTPATSLAPFTLYTATVAGARSLATNLAMGAPHVWSFTTGPIPDTTRPMVTSTAPTTSSPGTTGVPINTAIVAAFTESMTASSITAAGSFTVTCVAPCVSPAGSVSYVGNSRSAVFTPNAALATSTTYTARVTTAAMDLAGNALAGNQGALPAASDYVWTFTTATTTDTTRPAVTVTSPATSTPGPTGVPVNSSTIATFSEDMSPASVVAASVFRVTCTAPCTSPAGSVSYDAGSRTAVFTPSAALATSTIYTARVTTGATDLAGNALAGNQAAPPAASDYVWTFTTAAAGAPAANVSVLSTNPGASASGVCPNATANATFSVPSGVRMDPATVSAATFRITGPAPALTPVVAASVTLDVATGRVATFRPQTALTTGTTYTATITGGSSGVKDLAVPGNTMVSDFTWNFTVGAATGNCLAAPSLGSVRPFGTFGGTAGMTNTGILTVINGDIGTIAVGTSSITGFHDTAGDIYTESPANIGTVNGKIYSCTNSTTGPTASGPNAASCTVATQARLDAQTAYLALAAMPVGANPGGNLAGLTLTPGVYTAPAGSFLIQGGNLTLDAQGNANAVWVFQMATTLTVGGPGAAAPQSVILAGGAQAKNVFWQVGTAATINAGGGGTMVGTIISQAGSAFSTLGNVTLVRLEGRALSLGASVTLVNTVINVPAP
ncbi:MAG: Ig-like domain-containing protein [Steroidobacteraceae bacterium]